MAGDISYFIITGWNEITTSREFRNIFFETMLTRFVKVDIMMIWQKNNKKNYNNDENYVAFVKNTSLIQISQT